MPGAKAVPQAMLFPARPESAPSPPALGRRQPVNGKVARYVVDGGEIEGGKTAGHGIDSECPALARIDIELANELQRDFMAIPFLIYGQFVTG